MNHYLKVVTGLLAICAAPAAATLPMPSPAAASQDAQAFLFHAGAGDIFEIVTGQMAVKRSGNPAIRALGTMLIDHHTNASNGALTAARAAGVMPPPPELTPMQKDMVTQLTAAAPADFDRIFLTQQMSAHQQALALLQGYSTRGGVPTLRQAAAGTVPVVQSHLAQVQRLMAGTR